MRNKIKPIIKWTGGKYNEFALFEKYIPDFKRYIEPFFGGGGVFFALQPQTTALINDKSTDLISFYKNINNELFKSSVYEYVNAWDEITAMVQELWLTYHTYFSDCIFAEKEILSFSEQMLTAVSLQFNQTKTLKTNTFVIDKEFFIKYVTDSITDKTRRIKRIVKKESRIFTVNELKDHFETGIKSGFYLFFRNLLNQKYGGKIQLTDEKAAANWFFVREFCYGSMFRYNSKGHFNIPYGGIAYNRKNFRQKANRLFSPEIETLFRSVQVHNLDFEAFLKEAKLRESDFIFLDPPYDSEFSEYDQNAFTQKDQQRLADFLKHTKAKWMLVIKETAFIREIYTHPEIKIVTFSKNYTYNVRGRNDRAVIHLIITNY
ncbi:DNA adenine methylase [Pedobacter montanisoli]|uniref:site-specific DNA-methyltransferase (adenine-specific) n=1 Tax=Pedobacter montanisoli TaxID=2923277 RepID=A0ABS9ZY03_9SPHI|nr:DNA adenine methylase [Pedobacter montanisoli]MCJ0743193.1 DNA adenine methylase [Pedobacter montanisoli]